MDSHDVERVALMSIRPEFASAIFAGRKNVEFRRSRLAPDVEIVLVYATQPIGRIVGWFRIGGIAESTPDALWRRFRNHAGIRRRDYFAYFDGADRAYAIEIVKPTALIEPITLESLSPALRAPQSFQYVSSPVAAPAVALPPRSSRRAISPAFA